MRSRSTLSIVAALSLILADTALAGDSIPYEGRFPAKYPEASKLTEVAVLPFTGADGPAFTSALAAELQSATLDGQQLFSVKTPDGLTGKPKAGAKTSSEAAIAIRWGQNLGVKAVYIGEVTSAKITKTNRTEQRTTCAEPDGLFKCKRQETKNITCTRVVVDYSVTPRAINVATGAVVYSEIVSDQGSYDICDGRPVPVNASLADTWQTLKSSWHTLTGPSTANAPTDEYTEESLLLRVRTRVAEKVRRQVAPYNAVVMVTFKKKAPELSKADQARFKSGVDFSQAGRLDRACSIWEMMNSGGAANSVSLLYNLGVCQEALLPDDPNAALEYYAKADQLLSKPDKLVSDAYLRTKRMVEAQRSIHH